MPKESLKDRIDGNELDLSVSSLDVVPVTELIALPKATHLDLSCNLLRNLPNDFGTLQHLVHLDLSKNQLVELPKTFGDLKKLQHLDLLGNQLETLPVSLYRLRNLRWLDVKDNPLKEPLKGVVGDCLDERQCKACAVNVLNFMRKVQAEQERQLQKRLQEERELEEKRKSEENREKQRIKEERKREKERRRREHQERLAEQKKEEVTPDDSCPDKFSDSDEATEIVQQKVKRSGLSCCGVLLAILMGLTAVVLGLFIYCSSHSRDQTCRQAQIMVSEYQRDLQMIWRDTYDVVQDYFKKSSDPVNK